MAGGVGVLDPAVVSPTEQGPVAAEQRRPDGNATFGQTEAGFVESDSEEPRPRDRVEGRP